MASSVTRSLVLLVTTIGVSGLVVRGVLGLALTNSGFDRGHERERLTKTFDGIEFPTGFEVISIEGSDSYRFPLIAGRMPINPQEALEERVFAVRKNWLDSPRRLGSALKSQGFAVGSIRDCNFRARRDPVELHIVFLPEPAFPGSAPGCPTKSWTRVFVLAILSGR
jgi:hypothetical protein